MAHDLDGDWNVYVVTIDTAKIPPVAKIETNPTPMTLVHKAGGNDLDTGSEIGGHKLTGSSKPNGGGFDIDYSEEVGGLHRAHTGRLMDIDPVKKTKVMGGYRGGFKAVKPDDDRSKSKAAAFGQNDGIWIGTQP